MTKHVTVHCPWRAVLTILGTAGDRFARFWDKFLVKLGAGSDLGEAVEAWGQMVKTVILSRGADPADADFQSATSGHASRHRGSPNEAQGPLPVNKVAPAPTMRIKDYIVDPAKWKVGCRGGMRRCLCRGLGELADGASAAEDCTCSTGPESAGGAVAGAVIRRCWCRRLRLGRSGS